MFDSAQNMNQTLCGPGWAEALEKAVAGLSKTYGSAPDLAIMCCAAGQRLAGGSGLAAKCANCPVGWYQNHSDSKRTTCTFCSRNGTYTEDTARPCEDCPAGYYQNEPQLAFCLITCDHNLVVLSLDRVVQRLADAVFLEGLRTLVGIPWLDPAVE